MTSGKLFRLSVPTAMGRFKLLASDIGLRAVCWPGCELSSGLDLRPASAAPARVGRLLEDTGVKLVDYFKYPSRAVQFPAPLDLDSLTPFARKVLGSLAKLGYGRIISYGQLARRVGSANAARAVGSVLARNPLPIIVPCHRVLSARGSLGGFSAPGGLDFKRRLLILENALPPDQL